MTTTTIPKLRDLLTGIAPAIAVSFADPTSDEDLLIARREGLDVAELRIDRYSSTDVDHVVSHVRRFASFPTIATIRTADEGGDWTGSDADRVALFQAVIQEVDAIDIELSSTAILDQVVALAKAAGKVVIVSNHNFDATLPLDELHAMVLDAKAKGADFVKISAWAHTFDDVRTLAQLTLQDAELGLIVIAMGDHGTTSRVFFPALGSCLTYAWGPGWPVPGQLDFHDTFEALRRYYPEFNQKKIIELEILEDA